MTQAEGRFLRQTARSSWFGRVKVQIQHDPTGPHIVFDYPDPPFVPRRRPGAPRITDTIWDHAMAAGIHYALRATSREQFRVRVIYVYGTDMDTNPTILGAAAMQAVWNALSFTPLPADANRIEQIVLASWQQPDDHVPNFRLNSDSSDYGD